MTKEDIKSRMKHLARKFCRRNNVYKEFDCSVGKLVEKSYLSAYLLCLHESKNKIAELKERNAELKGMYAHSAREAGTYKQFLELKENENAELKKQQFSLRNERNTFLAQNEQYEKDLIDFNENLTKAKEIIQELVHEISVFYIATDRIVISPTVKQAEQFLRETENGK